MKFVSTRDCGTCALPTEHHLFEIKPRRSVWVCTECLTHWKPPKKAAVLYTCEGCGERRLLFTQLGQTVARPVPSCFRPDRRLVDQIAFQCAACVPAEVARA
jgi:hypothetical protein